MSTPRIALIHATAVAIDPIRLAFEEGWPQARITHLLDDSLSSDLAASGSIDSRMIDRFVALARYGAGCGSDAILFTCSAFGIAIDAARDAVRIPVLKPNEAMFDEALEVERSLALLSTFEPSLPSMLRELEAEAAKRSVALNIRSATAPDALGALQRGDADLHDRLIVEAGEALGDCEILMLAQFSMARAAALFPSRRGRRILSSPGSAVSRLKRDLAQ